eukprot:GCRY01003528.1.p4 GENE.GCRY01003528.1~~GCRY01003528.1.p4  ORF type:complete len:196 (+),score=42.02 GCRY01003528.1:3662-4249(+)
MQQDVLTQHRVAEALTVEEEWALLVEEVGPINTAKELEAQLKRLADTPTVPAITEFAAEAYSTLTRLAATRVSAPDDRLRMFEQTHHLSPALRPAPTSTLARARSKKAQQALVNLEQTVAQLVYVRETYFSRAGIQASDDICQRERQRLSRIKKKNNQPIDGPLSLQHRPLPSHPFTRLSSHSICPNCPPSLLLF